MNTSGGAGEQTYRDSTGRTLEDYPRPSVAVDTALLTVVPGENALSVLVVRRDPGQPGQEAGWGLPGTFLHPGERLVDAVLRSLREKAGMAGAGPRQLHVFDAPDRDPRGWVLSVAHVAVVPPERLDGRLRDRTRLIRVDAQEPMPYGHHEIVVRAVEAVRERYAEHPDPDRLLDEPFTLLDLRLVHEAVAGQPLQRDTFRRLMLPFLSPTGETTTGTRGRPAAQFRRKALMLTLPTDSRFLVPARGTAPATRPTGPGSPEPARWPREPVLIPSLFAGRLPGETAPNAKIFTILRARRRSSG